MLYLIETNDRRYVKGYGFLSFAKNVDKNISNKYSQKLVGSAKNSATDAIKTASKRSIQKTSEATGDLIGKKNANKIASVSKKSPKELHSKELHSTELHSTKLHLNEANNKIPNERYVSPPERQQIIDELLENLN